MRKIPTQQKLNLSPASSAPLAGVSLQSRPLHSHGVKGGTERPRLDCGERIRTMIQIVYSTPSGVMKTNFFPATQARIRARNLEKLGCTVLHFNKQVHTCKLYLEPDNSMTDELVEVTVL